MVIDTSALVGILAGEPERRVFIEAIETADSRLMSTATGEPLLFKGEDFARTDVEPFHPASTQQF